MRIGLVVEGTHDLIMLRELILKELAKVSEREVSFVELQPYPDQTGTFSGGGWSRVAAWCKDYSGDQITTFFEPLFANAPGCDVIVIHMDGDIVELTARHSSVQFPGELSNAAVVVQTLNQVIIDWLSPTQENKARVAVAVPVLHTESWLMAGHCAPGINVEEIDAKQAFRRKYSRRSKMKLAEYYGLRTQELCSERHKPEDCQSYRLFAEDLLRVTSPFLVAAVI